MNEYQVFISQEPILATLSMYRKPYYQNDLAQTHAA